MATPHNNANVNEIAPIVLMPGDPLRAKFIAENFLEDVKQFNSVRNMFGYTGTYKGKQVSVMGSGMGMPSIGIYSYELYTQYNVETIIRIGSCGSYCEEAKVFDVILAKEAYSESSYAYVQSGYDKDKTYPDATLNETILNTAKKLNMNVLYGGIHSSDVFYREDKTPYHEVLYKDKGCLAVEMESFALFHNAAVLNKKAACILTVSDSFVSSVATTSKERETAFVDMMRLALESIL